MPESPEIAEAVEELPKKAFSTGIGEHCQIGEGADPDNAKKVLSWEACGRVV
jgi:hypothetical protein